MRLMHSACIRNAWAIRRSRLERAEYSKYTNRIREKLRRKTFLHYTTHFTEKLIS
jgi:hypothetical protein